MKRSIFKKIQKQVLISSIVAALAVCLAAVACIVVMRDSLVTTSGELGSAAARDSRDALETQMERALMTLADNRATISDQKLTAVVRMIDGIAYNSSEVVSNPHNYLPRSVDFPNADNAGITVAQLRLAEGVHLSEVQATAGLMGNLSELLISEHDALDYVRSVYLGTEDGVSLSADGDSDKKTNVFDPRTRGWYQSAKETGGLIWTDVFADATGRGLTITCAKPFYDENGIYGVAGVGMLLEFLNEIVVETTVGETGYAFITNEHGEMIISDTVTIDENNAVISRNVAEFLPQDTVTDMLNGGTNIRQVEIDGELYLISYAPLSALPWSLAVVMSADEVIAPALSSENNIIGMTRKAVVGIDRVILFALGVFVAALLLTLYGSAILGRRLSAGLAKPIIELSEGAGIIGAGDLEHKLDIKTGDELEAMACAFNTMITNIKVITAEKERIGAELDVATQIQASMLPSIFPPYPDHDEFDLFASMQPAKEVGGDFYDFFLVDENTLAVVMADVSGKGVPAALFMVIAKTLIKNNAQSGKSPKEVFESVNNILCENNDANMFVTAILGYLDIPTGKFTFVNAGHNPPLLRSGKAGFDWLKTRPGFILAGMEGMSYTQHEVLLQPNDELFLYTDGVTEAMNNEKDLFSDPRLLETANNHLDLHLSEFTNLIKKEIDDFAEGAEQADDITMLSLRYTGGGK
ncbi:MAG: SpoIIE family protein phosphatase [Defluviitaleaceae bacterium]|nr:SpoIIE family protein phosphatase [Defluviitaleaceae bacterium]